MARHSEFDVNKVANRLLGQCDSLDDILERFYEMSEDDMTMQDARELDDLVMCCTLCGWWVDSSEVDDDSICEECQN